MSLYPSPLVIAPRLRCGVSPAGPLTTLSLLLAFVVLLAALGHEPQLAAAIAAALAVLVGSPAAPEVRDHV